MAAVSSTPDAVRHWVVLPAAGAGRRLGAAIPKQYLILAGRTVIEWSLAAFLDRPGLLGICVALAVDDRRWPQLASSRRAEIAVCDGGLERSDSVLCALRALQPAVEPHDWVLVHDAARPCIARSDVDGLLAALREHEVGGLLATPLTDTLKRADADRCSEGTVARERLWRALTPQMFRYRLLRDALERTARERVAITDEAAAIERMNLRPLLVEGRADNLKITRAQDLDLAAAILTSRQQR